MLFSRCNFNFQWTWRSNIAIPFIEMTLVSYWICKHPALFRDQIFTFELRLGVMLEFRKDADI